MPDNPFISLDPCDELATNLYTSLLDLYPICRSITGNGVRQTLDYLNQIVPLEITEVPSGSEVFDWEVPEEWNVSKAYIADDQGRRIVDFQQHNLHLVNYSTPIKAHMPLQELKKHLHTLPDQPELIPYRTSYYKRDWGFCLSQKQFDGLSDQEYEVCIESQLSQGSLTYAEAFLPGATKKEVLISCHICHPSLANDNLTGMVVAAYLAAQLKHHALLHSYRFLFVPATIGSLCWLSNNRDKLDKVAHGLVLTGLGGNSPFTYKRSRSGDNPIDKACELALRSDKENNIVDFSPFGYDERQYCSPGFDLPVGRLSRAPHGSYPEYHTSADNPSIITPEQLLESLQTCLNIINTLEHNGSFENLKPHGEPMLSKYELYSSMGGLKQSGVNQQAIPWILNLSDGSHSLVDIATKAGIDLQDIATAAEKLTELNLIRRLENH